MQREVTAKLEQQMETMNKKHEEMEKKLQESQVCLKLYIILDKQWYYNHGRRGHSIIVVLLQVASNCM